MTYGITNAGSPSVTKSRKPADADRSAGTGFNHAGGSRSAVETTIDDQTETSGSEEDHVGEDDGNYKGKGKSTHPNVHAVDNNEQGNAPVPKVRYTSITLSFVYSFYRWR